MKNYYITIIALLSIVSSGLSQSFNNSQLVGEIWTQQTGSPADTLNWTNQVLDASRNLIIIGNSLQNNQTTNMLLTKYNHNDGSVLWEVQYDNSGNDDYGISLVCDAAENIYTATTSFVSTTNGYDWIIQKYNSSGTVLWTQTFNSGIYDVPTDMKHDGNGNLYVTGVRTTTNTLQDYCTIKYNAANGNELWATPSYYNYANLIDIPAAITLAVNNRLVVAGGSASTPTNWDFATVRYNSSTGAQINSRRNPSNGLGFDQITGVAKDQNDNIYITGRAAVSGNGYNIKTVKLDTALSTVWSSIWDGDHLDDGGNAIGVDANGYIYVTGYTNKTNGGSDYVRLKYSSSGSLQWQKKYAAPDPTKSAVAKKLDIDPYGNILILGDAYKIGNRDILTVAYDITGKKKWEEWYSGPGDGDDYASAIKIDDATRYFYVTGKIWTTTGYKYTTTKYQMIDYITPPDKEIIPLGLAYYENNGQVIGSNNSLVPQVKFYSIHQSPSLFVQNDQLSFTFTRFHSSATGLNDTLQRVDLSFQNSLSTKVYKVSSHIPGFLNFFKPWCSNGVTGVRGYQKLLLPNVYSKIDVMLSSNSEGMKMYMIGNVSSRPGDIKLKFDGATSVQVLGNGSLRVNTIIGRLILDKPEVYQMDQAGNKISLNWQSAYVSLGSNQFGLTVGSYDLSKPIIFEIKEGNGEFLPFHLNTPEWSMYFGGSGDEEGTDVEIDADGNPYFSGFTSSHEQFPSVPGIGVITPPNGGFDVFVAKFGSADGATLGVVSEADMHIWTTIWGGTNDENLTRWLLPAMDQ